MSTSAVTAVLDRLERRGFNAAGTPADRRKVIVYPTGHHTDRIAPTFARMRASVDELLREGMAGAVFVTASLFHEK